MPDKVETKIYLEISLVSQPTEFDDVGCDGVYVKSVKALSSEIVKKVEIVLSLARKQDRDDA